MSDKRLAKTRHVDARLGRCPCGEYHYKCADCGSDCTSGKPASPAHTDVQGVTRCDKCHRKAETEGARLIHAAPDLFAACEALDSFLGTPSGSEFRNLQKLAAAALAKARGLS